MIFEFFDCLHHASARGILHKGCVIENSGNGCGRDFCAPCNLFETHDFLHFTRQRGKNQPDKKPTCSSCQTCHGGSAGTNRPGVHLILHCKLSCSTIVWYRPAGGSHICNSEFRGWPQVRLMLIVSRTDRLRRPNVSATSSFPCEPRKWNQKQNGFSSPSAWTSDRGENRDYTGWNGGHSFRRLETGKAGSCHRAQRTIPR